MASKRRFEKYSELESVVRAHIRKLKSALADVGGAGNYLADSGRPQASAPITLYQSQQNYQQTAPGSPSAFKQTQQILAQALADVERIANSLERDYIPETKRHLESLHEYQGNLIKDGGTLGPDPAKHYREGVRTTSDYVRRGKMLLIDIYSAVKEARRSLSKSSAGTQDGSFGLETLLPNPAPTQGRVPDYTSDVIDDQLYRLDTRRYGEDDEVTTTNYPTPYLSREGDREATLLEKATLGGAGPVPLPDNVYHPVSLPSYLRRIKHRGYHSSGSGGRYDAALKYS